MTDPTPRKPGPRTVHAAMLLTVQDAGDDVARAIYNRALWFNQEYFGDELTALLVEITAPASPRAFATHQARTPEGVDCVIRIGPGVVAEGPLVWEDVLLHEMIHVWQAETGRAEPGYAGHGPHFAAKCNEIGAKLGLGKVSAKGRRRDEAGAFLPDCAQWPLNVRPPGYYPEGGRAAKATKPKAPRVRRVSEPAPDAPESDRAPEPQDRVQAALALVAAMTPAERAAFVGGLTARPGRAVERDDAADEGEPVPWGRP